MAKGDAGRAKTAINNQQTQADEWQGSMRKTAESAYNTAYTKDTDLRNYLTDQYKSFAPGNLNDLLGSFGGGGGVSGGIDPSHISDMGNEEYAGYQDMSKGLKEPFWNDFNKYMGGLEESRQGYKNFADTGGFSGNDIATMRSASLAPAQSAYEKQGNDLTRQMARGGINNAGYLQRELERDRTKDLSAASVQNESNLAGMVQQGKEFGTTGMANVSTNQLNIRNQVEQMDQTMRAMGLGGMSDIDKTKLQAELQNAQLNQNSLQGNASLGMQRAGMSMAALNGLQNLYTSVPGESQQDWQNMYNEQNLAGNQNQGLINSRIQASQIPGDFQQALGNIGSVVGMAGSLINPIAGIFGKTMGGGSVIPGTGLPAPTKPKNELRYM